MVNNTSSNSFTTRDWVNSTKDTPVFAYNPAEGESRPSAAVGTFTQDDFESALKKASRKKAAPHQK